MKTTPHPNTPHLESDYFLNFVLEQSQTPTRLLTVDMTKYLYDLAGLRYDESRFTPRATANPPTFFVEIESASAIELVTAARTLRTNTAGRQLSDLELLEAFENNGTFSSSMNDVAARLNITGSQLESACKRARKERARHQAFNTLLLTQNPIRDYPLDLISPVIAARNLVRPLKAASIETIGQLADITERHFLAIKGMGTKRLADARLLLHHFELTFQPISTETLISDRAIARYNSDTMKSPTSTHDFAYEVATLFSTDCSEYSGATIEIGSPESWPLTGHGISDNLIVLHLHKSKLVSLAIGIRFNALLFPLSRQLPDLHRWKELAEHSLYAETEIYAVSFDEAWQIITLTCLFLRASAIKVSYGI